MCFTRMSVEQNCDTGGNCVEWCKGICCKDCSEHGGENYCEYMGEYTGECLGEFVVNLLWKNVRSRWI